MFRCILMLAVSLPVLLRADVADGVKAVVNDRVITFAEVEEYTRPAAEALRRQYAGQPEIFQQKLNEALNDSLEQLVDRALILHYFETEGFKLPDSLVDQLVQERIHDKFSDRVTLMKTLQTQGMTFEQFRKQLREQYIESALRQQNINREITISPFKVQTYYQANQDKFKLDDQVKLRMIVLTKTTPDDTNVVKMAREIQSKVKEGTPFTEMAMVYSQGSQQHQAGDWGWVERNVLRKELADVAFNLKPGETSDPIDTPDATYFMLVEDKKPAQFRPLSEVRADVEKTLRVQEQARLEKAWIDGLKKKTFIRYF
jgi:peptidyl-prolyl cis-trans isomerase SurA